MDKDTSIKRKATKIEIAFGNKKDLKELYNNKEFQSIIMEDSFKGIKEAINKKWEKVELFNIINLSIIIEISSTSFSSALKKISNYFESYEEYEKCAEIKQLVNKIKK